MARKNTPEPPSTPEPGTADANDTGATGDTGGNDTNDDEMAEQFAGWMDSVDRKMSAIPDDLGETLKRIEASLNGGARSGTAQPGGTQTGAGQGAGGAGGTAGAGSPQGLEKSGAPFEPDRQPKSSNWYFRDRPKWLGRGKRKP